MIVAGHVIVIDAVIVAALVIGNDTLIVADAVIDHDTDQAAGHTRRPPEPIR